VPDSTRPPAAAPDAEHRGAGDTRAKLLAAAARVYAQHGYLGATTRQIAKEADVHEVTLFRLFRSKDALVEEAVRVHASREIPAALPDEPVDPERELATWCAGEIARLRRSGELLRQCFASADEHPTHIRDAAAGITDAARVVRRYVDRLVERDLVSAPEHAVAASAMLVSALLADALAREQMPGVHPTSASAAPTAYARAFLAALGVSSVSAAARAPGART
jgi:AcrR family transcriptional regulator